MSLTSSRDAMLPTDEGANFTTGDWVDIPSVGAFSSEYSALDRGQFGHVESAKETINPDELTILRKRLSRLDMLLGRHLGDTQKVVNDLYSNVTKDLRTMKDTQQTTQITVDALVNEVKILRQSKRSGIPWRKNVGGGSATKKNKKSRKKSIKKTIKKSIKKSRKKSR
jgi:hypothetical protein